MYLGVPPFIDPDNILWLFKFFTVKGFTNLNEKVVLKPRSTLYLSECHKHPDFKLFLVDVILKQFYAESNLMSPS